MPTGGLLEILLSALMGVGICAIGCACVWLAAILLVLVT